MTVAPKVLMTRWIMMLPTEMKLCCKILGTAMTAMRPRSEAEKICSFPVPRNPASRLTTNSTASTQLTPWQMKVAHATPATPIRNAVTNRISRADVRRRRSGKKPERRAGISECGENTGRNVIKEDERQTRHINIEVQAAIVEEFWRGVDHLKQGIREKEAAEHEHGAKHRTRDARCGNGCFHFTVFFCTEELGHDDGHADVTAERERKEDQGDLVAVSDCCERIFADEFSGDQGCLQGYKAAEK